jgi:ABC-type nitrate/sulfonate/bicarbonate transport system permease component
MTGFDRRSVSLPPNVQCWGLRLLSLCVFALAWELLARHAHSLLVPTFSQTAAALVGLLATPELWQALWVSNQAMVLGFTAAALAGIPVGFLMARLRTAEKMIDPYLSILLVTPMSALVPILIMATGLGLFTRVLIVFSFAVVVITVNTRAGLETIEESWIEMAESFGATERQLWRQVLLPGALPAILAGLRLGLARSISGMLFVELILLALGIGRMILDFQGGFDSANLYATIVVIVGEAVILIQLLRWVERRLTPWTEPAVVE